MFLWGFIKHGKSNPKDITRKQKEHTFQGNMANYFVRKKNLLSSKASEISAETSTTWLETGVILHEYLFIQLAEPYL